MSTSSTGVDLEDALPLTYHRLVRLARTYLSRLPGADPRDSGAMVHEAALRLLQQRRRHWNDLPHFVGSAATVLRRVILDRRRRHGARRRGGGAAAVPSEGLTESCAASAPRQDEGLALHRALAGLKLREPRQAKVVHLRFLVGMTVEETAEELDIAPATVRRDWAAARRRLRRDLMGG
jgi:RNA polymerase sigma factor (TIGR02999 family)